MERDDRCKIYLLVYRAWHGMERLRGKKSASPGVRCGQIDAQTDRDRRTERERHTGWKAGTANKQDSDVMCVAWTQGGHRYLMKYDMDRS